MFKLRKVIGKARKSIAMAELFIEENADILVDYGKDAHRVYGDLQERVYSATREIPITDLLYVIKHQIQDKLKIENANVFIDGNFSYGEVVLIEKYIQTQQYESRLTISVQDNKIDQVIVQYQWNGSMLTRD